MRSSNPVIRTGPTLFSSSRLDESTCLWNGKRYSVGATFCAGTGRVQGCMSPDKTHGDARWVATLANGQCNPATYPNSR